MSDKKSTKEIFLHDRKVYNETSGYDFKDKDQLSEYNKKRRAEKKQREKELEGNGFVNKTLFELQFGFKDSGDWYVDTKKGYKKYMDKYEYYRGIHAQRERR
tara:strand:+ start:6218 stop:6523 length:306 start_codon:yes stop_codon:yes gene_type:complete